MLFRNILKILAATAALVIGSVAGGTLTTLLGMKPPPPLPNTTPESLLLGFVLAGPLLPIALAPLASGLPGRLALRWLALAVLTYLAWGVNNAIEGSIFMPSTAPGLWTNLVFHLMPALFVAAPVAFWFSKPGAIPPLPGFGAAGWMWRVVLALLAFPTAYWIFGMMIAPIVMPYYNSGALGLAIPEPAVIFGVQILRSALFLAASLPVILLWSGSRRGLFLALGFAHAILVGIYGLAQATFFPAVLRVVHSLEITADSFAYAAALALLFGPKAANASPVREQEYGRAAVSAQSR